MRNSLSLNLYRLTKSKRSDERKPLFETSVDPVVWIAAHDAVSIRAFLNIARKLEKSGHVVTFLVTVPEALVDDFKPEPNVRFSTFPTENRRDCRSFLEHWRPVVGFWVGAPLYPTMIQEASALSIPLVLLNASETIKPEGIGYFHSQAVIQSLRAFGLVFATTFVSGGICVRYGIPDEAITVSGPLAEGSIILAVDEQELDVNADTLRGREVWLASNVPDSEIDHVLAAHQTLRGTNRRLLLILNPSDPSQSETLAIALADKGWRAAIRSKGDAVNSQTQIYLADKPEELGLWYRLAPITYVGGTLVLGEKGRDPLEAAALGSAIVHGPRTTPHRESFGHLHSLTPPAATQIVTPENLARAVSELLSPDVAAAQANSAWEYVSRGAELTDQIVELIVEAVEMAEEEDE